MRLLDGGTGLHRTTEADSTERWNRLPGNQVSNEGSDLLSASTFATHHIVVLDATAHLLDGFLQRTEAVGNADAEVAGTHIVEGLHAESLVLGRAIHLDVFPERVVAREGDSELLLEETLVE